MMWWNHPGALALVLTLGVATAAARENNRVAPAGPDYSVQLARTALSYSGAVRTRMVLPGHTFALPLEWTPVQPMDVRYQWVSIDERNRGEPLPVPAGTALLQAPERPGAYRLHLLAETDTSIVPDFTLVVKVPLPETATKLNGYNIGAYPAQARARKDRYAAPDGLIEVNRGDRELRLSEHFTVGEFLTHDQVEVWPKYAVVEPRLLDKLELVLADLEARGIPAQRMVVMSGYRTPQYNRQGLDKGRATLSRHQYGDAADVWVDNDGDGYMDDLNKDGRRDTGDARVMLQSVDRVEARHPELIGGAGIYRDNGAHGPFIHIDTRGSPARW
jgi:hypothetical protein